MPTAPTSLLPASDCRHRATAERRGRNSICLCLLLGLLLALLNSPRGVRAEGFSVEQASAELVDGVYQVDARLNYQLDGKPREALENGVPLVLEVELRVQRAREYLWNETIAEVLTRHKLKYRALTQQYQLENLTTGEIESFTSLNSALNHLRQLRNFPLIDASLLQPDQDYLLGVSTNLDIEALPTPLRALAYVTSDWYRSSAWFTLPLR